VELLTPTLTAGQDLGLTLDLENWHRRGPALGPRIFTSGAPPRYPADRGQGGEAYSRRVVEVGPVDTPMGAHHRRPDDPRYFALKGSVEVHRAGDCLAPRRAGDAINEGHRVALAL